MSAIALAHLAPGPPAWPPRAVEIAPMMVATPVAAIAMSAPMSRTVVDIRHVRRGIREFVQDTVGIHDTGFGGAWASHLRHCRCTGNSEQPGQE